MILLGSERLCGVYGAYLIDGSRNFLTSKDRSESSSAGYGIARWVGPLAVKWDGGTASVTIDKKGKAKVSIVLSNGTKGTVTCQLLIGDDWYCIPVMFAKQGVWLAFTVWLPQDWRADVSGFPVVVGLGDNAEVGKPGFMEGRMAFRLDANALIGQFGQETLPYLPDEVWFSNAGSKWTLPKAGKLTMKKGVLDTSKAGDNPSGLKLSPKKDGTFTGSFKVYYADKGKLKSKTANITGIVINGVGYGTATIKNVGSVPITIE